jgi:hypothetical protein
MIAQLLKPLLRGQTQLCDRFTNAFRVKLFPPGWFHLYAVWSPRRIGPGLKIFLKLISEHGSINPEELPAAPAAA